MRWKDLETISKKDKITNIKLLLYLLIYKTTIEWIYIYFIVPRYSYSGLNLNSNIYSYLISTISVVAITFLIPKNRSRASTYLYIIFVTINIIPTLSFYWLSSKDIAYVGIMILALMTISIVIKIRLPKINIRSNTANIWIILLFYIYLITTIILILQRGGIDHRAFDFDLIYELRSETQISGINGYLLNWSTKAFAPFFFAYFYYYRKRMMLGVVIALQLLMYLSFGNKAFLFSIGVLILITLIIRRNNFIKEYLLLMSGLNIFAYIIDNGFKINTLSRAIPYRLVFIPAQIQYQYYDFFNGREKLLFADGLIGKIFSIQSPFSDNISKIIGMYYSRNGLGTNANTGMISDAYANGGIIGVGIIATLFGIILLIIDSSTSKLPLYVKVGSLSYITFVLNDTGLLTTFFTGGMGIMILLLVMFNSSIGNEKTLKRNIFSVKSISENEKNKNLKEQSND